MTKRSSRGLWIALSALELAESSKIAEMLRPFFAIVTDCYECGVEVATLSCRHMKTKDVKVAALFLKRSLNDLRAVWNLLMLGYTSQAGTVAAAAFENSLLANCISGHADRAEKMLKSKSGESPWTLADLCKFEAAHATDRDEESAEILSDRQYDAYWRRLYTQYSWLCNLKHPSLPSALHDASAVLSKQNEFIIMAAPDSRNEDLPNKVLILTVTILRLHEAIASFADARQLDLKDPEVVAWRERFNSTMSNLLKVVDPYTQSPLAFQVKPK
jgi:hypothetical protein